MAKSSKVEGKYSIGDGKYQDHCDSLAEDLIPFDGKCETLGGEMLRCAILLHNDFFRNNLYHYVTGAIVFLEKNLIPKLDKRITKKEMTDALKFLKPMTEHGEFAYSSIQSQGLSIKKARVLIWKKLDAILDTVLEFILNDIHANDKNVTCWMELQDTKKRISSRLSQNFLLYSAVNLKNFFVLEDMTHKNDESRLLVAAKKKKKRSRVALSRKEDKRKKTTISRSKSRRKSQKK